MRRKVNTKKLMKLMMSEIDNLFGYTKALFDHIARSRSEVMYDSDELPVPIYKDKGYFSNRVNIYINGLAERIKAVKEMYKDCKSPSIQDIINLEKELCSLFEFVHERFSYEKNNFK